MVEKIKVRTRKGEFQWINIGLTAENLQYVAKSSNVKTGKTPAQFIGSSREESESTCRICPLWKNNTCYAQDGSPQLGHNALLRVTREGRDRGLDQALEGAHEDAKYVRFGSIGDPGSIAPEVYDDHEGRAREYGFGVISYTHQWYLDHAQFLKGRALASADTMKDVVDSVAAGWRSAVHVDADDPCFDGHSINEKQQGTMQNGVKYFLCPAQRVDAKGEDIGVTCNDCGLCDGTKDTKYNTIVFVEHGLQMGFTKLRARRAAEVEAREAAAITMATFPECPPASEPMVIVTLVIPEPVPEPDLTEFKAKLKGSIFPR